MTKHARLVDRDSFFDRFAGIFISFGQLERSVRESLAAGKDRAAEYRLFGQKYDSLGRLLSRIQEDEAKTADNLVEHYVMALCARQMVNELRKDLPDFFGEHAEEAKRLEEQLAYRGRTARAAERRREPHNGRVPAMVRRVVSDAGKAG